jgi:hypothetical protein
LVSIRAMPASTITCPGLKNQIVPLKLLREL